MSLSAAQTRILRDMAGGAVLAYDVTDGWDLDGVPLDFTTDIQPISRMIFNRVESGGTTYYALTPAGAAAAGEGAE